MSIIINDSRSERAFVKNLRARLREGRPLIQVILGPRQVGKTTGVEQCLRDFPRAHYANADESLYQSVEWIDEQWQAAKMADARAPILVIDEIQKIQRWSEKIKALWDAEWHAKSRFKLVLLGSSSPTLSAGLDESLAGRFELIPVYHWGFDESRAAFRYDLKTYLLYGGYPYAAKLKKDFGRWQAYLKSSIIETVIGKDILRHAQVRKPALFRQVFEILSSYPAREVSYNRILGQLQEGGNTDLVKHYIHLLSEAFLFKALEKYSGSAVRRKVSSPKILPLAPSLYTYRLGEKDLDDPETMGWVFEAAVGAEISRMPGELFYWRDGMHEVDFVHVHGSTVTAIEVKAGRRKRGHGLAAFRGKFPKSRVAFVTPENYPALSADPAEFFEKI
ncbi:MAG: ATP-binding protein [Deltaproteobacteria bacterium]|nr:ATP-binding protein [Deltaproteobacteria bacterium]